MKVLKGTLNIFAAHGTFLTGNTLNQDVLHAVTYGSDKKQSILSYEVVTPETADK